MSEPYPSPFASRSPGGSTAASVEGSRSPETSTPPVEGPAQSAAVMRCKSCRWRRPPDEGTECCGHRDVLPVAGTTGFDPEAWCPDCAFYKLRRTPKKRSPEDYQRY